MIKVIIKRNARCKSCDSILEFEISDINKTQEKIMGTPFLQYYIICPVCKKEVIVSYKKY